MVEELETEIYKLKIELDGLRVERREKILEVEKWAEKRDLANKRAQQLRNRVGELKQKRNSFNSKVKDFKELREKAASKSREKKNHLRKLKERLRNLMRERPKRSFKSFQEEINRLEWEVQTTPHTIQDERQIIDRVKKLVSERRVHEEIAEHKTSIINTQIEISKLQEKANLFHVDLLKSAQESDVNHQELTKVLRELSSVKEGADEKHGKFLQLRSELHILNEKRKAISNELRLLKKKLRQIEEENRKKQEEKITEKLRKEAGDKLERGKKISWEEFQLLSEESDE